MSDGEFSYWPYLYLCTKRGCKILASPIFYSHCIDMSVCHPTIPLYFLSFSDRTNAILMRRHLFDNLMLYSLSWKNVVLKQSTNATDFHQLWIPQDHELLRIMFRYIYYWLRAKQSVYIYLSVITFLRDFRIILTKSKATCHCKLKCEIK